MAARPRYPCYTQQRVSTRHDYMPSISSSRVDGLARLWRSPRVPLSIDRRDLVDAPLVDRGTVHVTGLLVFSVAKLKIRLDALVLAVPFGPVRHAVTVRKGVDALEDWI